MSKTSNNNKRGKFQKYTHNTDVINAKKAIGLGEKRQLQLGEDCGIYITEENGERSSRVDAVQIGKPSYLTMYDDDYRVCSAPFGKIVQKTNSKTGKIERQLDLEDGSILASQIKVDEDVGLVDKIEKLESKIDGLNSIIQTLLTEINSLKEKCNKEPSPSIQVEVNSVDDKVNLEKWKFKLTTDKSNPEETFSNLLLYHGEDLVSQFSNVTCGATDKSSEVQKPVNNDTPVSIVAHTDTTSIPHETKTEVITTTKPKPVHIKIPTPSPIGPVTTPNGLTITKTLQHAPMSFTVPLRTGKNGTIKSTPKSGNVPPNQEGATKELRTINQVEKIVTPENLAKTMAEGKAVFSDDEET